MYAIPVYTTTTHAMTNVYAYKKNGTAFTQTAITIDINSQSNKYNPAMPDLMRIKFQGGKTYTFGTVLTDVNGDMLYARAKNNKTLGEGKVNVLGTSYKLEYAYMAGLIYDVASASDVEAFNAGGLTIGLFEKQGDRYVQVAQGSAVNGKTYYKVRTETVDGVEYVKLDYSKLPTGSNFPVGWVKYDEYTFDWAGGAVDVNFEYQWGFSAIHESTISVPVKGYEINPEKITNFAKTENADVADTIKNFTSFDAFKDLDSILANPAYNNSLAEYIKEFKYVNGKYTSGSYTNLSVEWDLTNLEKRLAEIKNGDSYDYYKGIDVVVTAKVGANVFRYVTGYDEDGEPIYGFAGEGATGADGSVAQIISIPVKVAGRMFESLANDALVFDAYSSDAITGDAFATNIKVFFKGSEKAVVLDSNSLTITAPFVLVGGEYVQIDPITNDNFSYLGYEGEKLYARLEIGTAKSGKQVVYVSINVTAMTASQYTLNVDREHTLNPEWYSLADAYNVITVSFKEKGTQSHKMKIDWSTVKYYSNATCTKEVDNIYKGGTIYAMVQANPCDADGNILTGANGWALGSDKGVAQTIKIKLVVPRKSITDVKFLGNTGSSDIYTSGAIDTMSQAYLADINNYTASSYAEYILDGTTYNLSTYNYTLNPDNYFRVGEWGDYRNGTAVAITYTTGGVEYTEMAFVREWNLDGLKISSNGGTAYAVATVGAQQFTIELNTPSLAIRELTLEGASSVKFLGGGTTATDLDFASSAPAFEYNVFEEWNLPTRATVRAEQEASALENVVLAWVDDSVPGSISSDFVIVNGKKGFRTDEQGSYVLRKVRFYQGSILYPAKEALEVKIYLVDDNSDSIVTDATNVDTARTAPDNLDLTYSVFGEFTLPTTATVNYVDGTPARAGVPVVWSAGAPTASEIKAGRFTRTAYIGANLMSAEYTFTVEHNYALGGIGNVGELQYHLTTEGFYEGLPTSATIYPDKDDTSVAYYAALNWAVEYDNNGSITSGLNDDGTVNVQITANGVSLVAKVMLTVDATEIAFADVNMTETFVIDPLGIETTLFAQGEHTVLATAGTDEEGAPIYQEVVVRAEYSLPYDFETNAVKYFGETLTLNVVFNYAGGSQAMTITCVVLDRTIDSLVNEEYTSITVDPYRHNTFREGGLGLPLEVEAYLTDGTIATFVPEWPSDDLITSRGYSKSNYMVTFRAYAESENGEYVKYTYMQNGIEITRYGTPEEARALNATTDGKLYTMGATQKVNIPVEVISREVESAVFVTPDYEMATRTEARTTYTIKYISTDVTQGDIFDVIYSAKTNMPTSVIYYNGFAFGRTPMPSEIEITFAKTGEVQRYYIVLEGIEALSATTDVTKTKEATVKVHVYNNSSMDFEIFSFDVKFTVKKVSVTRNNSTLVSENLSDQLQYAFDVYADPDNGNSIYNTSNYNSTTTFYPDGKFVTLDEWNEASASGYRTLRYLSTGEYIYKVLGEGTVVNNRVAVDGAGNRIGTPTYYQYDSTTKTYKVVASVEDATHIFVYSVSQVLDVDWNPNQTAISVKGGQVYVYATVYADNGATTEVKVLVEINDGIAVAISADESDFVDSEAVADYMTVTGNTLTFTFDPYTSSDALEQLATGNFKYFPARATITFANGTVANVPITWDFGIAKINCQGGTYNIRAIVDGSAYGIGTQEIRANLVVLSRTAVGIVESANTALTSNVGYMWQGAGTQTYINPYEFYISSLKLPETLTVLVECSDGTEEQIVYSTTGDTYKLRWSTKDFRPTYQGGITYLTAKLVGPDGSTQNLQIPFLVQRMTATNVTTVYYMDEERVASPKIKNARYSTNPYTSAVVDGVATTAYTSSKAFPTGLKVTFKIENPVVDSEGNITFVETTVGTGWSGHKNGSTNSKVFAYVSSITPATITADSTISVQIGGGERIQIALS